MSEHRRKPPQGRGRRAQQPPQPPQVPPGRRAAPPHQATSRSYGAGPGRTAPGGYAGTGRGGQDGSLVGAPRPGGRAEARRAAQRGGRRRASNASGAGAGVGGRAAARERARAAQAAKKRFIDYPRSGKYGFRRWMPSWKQCLGTFVGFAAMMMGLAGIGYAMVEVPNPNTAAISQQNVYYWADGSRMVTAGGEKNRQMVELSDIPLEMQNAVIAAENDTFYEDSGISPIGIARAAFKMAMGGQTQSGSTITQQYVKNYFLTPDQTLKRKVRELFISIKVDAEYGKDEILAGYLNTAFYGRGSWGIQAASHAYYRKDAKDLTPSESAFMAVLLNAPNLYDPYGGVPGVEAQSKEKNTQRAKARWKWTLKRQVETGRMTDVKRDKILKEGFPRPKPPQKSAGLKGQIGYLVDIAKDDITSNPESGITNKMLKNGGYQIYTTFEKDKVNALETTIKDVRKENLKPEERKEDKFVQFGGASVRPGDGALVAVYGGYSAVGHWNNNAIYTGAAVGSTFKPFVMAAALDNGVRDPDLRAEQGPESRIPVSPKTVYPGDSGIKLLNYDGTTWLNKKNEEWHTPNEGETDYGPISLNKAMMVSANTPFIQLGVDVGLKKVEEAALAAGLGERGLVDNLTPSYSLGISAPSAISLANGYATFANSGVYSDTYAVTEVKDGSESIYKHEEKQERAFDPSVADTVTGMLQNVVNDGTGSGVREALGNRPAAGKTGTTDDNRTAWFAGYTPQLSTAIGMWRSDPENPKFLSMYGTADQDQIHGASFPAGIWSTYMNKALEGAEPEPFPEAPPITGDKYCAHDACPSPSPTPSPSKSDDASPSPSVPTTPSPTVAPTPVPSCDQLWGCTDQGTTTGPGGDTNGMDGGTTDGGSTGGPGGSQATTGGDSDGGLLGGPQTDTEGRTEGE